MTVHTGNMVTINECHNREPGRVTKVRGSELCVMFSKRRGAFFYSDEVTVTLGSRILNFFRRGN